MQWCGVGAGLRLPNFVDLGMSLGWVDHMEIRNRDIPLSTYSIVGARTNFK